MADDLNAAATAPVQDTNAGGNGVPQQVNDPAIPAAQPVPSAQPAQPGALTQQADFQAALTRESRKAVEKLLKDAGIMPGDNPEMQFKEYKKWLDGQKTDLQRAQESEQVLTGERDAARAELSAMQNTLAAIQKGVPADKASLYIKMTELHTADGKSFDEALDAVLKEFPIAAPPKEATPTIVLPASAPADGKKAAYVPPKLI